jgi:hypothetical protein
MTSSRPLTHFDCDLHQDLRCISLIGMALPDPKQNQAYFDVSALEAGHAHAPISLILAGHDESERVWSPSLAFLLRSPSTGKTIAFDLGIRKVRIRFSLICIERSRSAKYHTSGSGFLPALSVRREDEGDVPCESPAGCCRLPEEGWAQSRRRRLCDVQPSALGCVALLCLPVQLLNVRGTRST